MITTKVTDIIVCDMCRRQQLLPDDLEEGWFRIENPRTSELLDKIERLDFCSPVCVVDFINAEWTIKRANGERLLLAQDSYKMPILTFLKAYKTI